MKKVLFTTLIVASFGAGSAQANEVFADNTITSAIGTVSSEAAQNLNLCLNSNIDTASSRAIRACTKAYKASVPVYDIRSDIITRRGMLQLSAGRFDKASKDFKTAAKLNNENEFAFLGEGFAAMLREDYASAETFFKDCTSHNQAAPLALYGLAMTKELKGDTSAAKMNYEKALKLRPDWDAARAELKRVNAKI